MSGPLVRSSYRAGRLYAQAIEQRAASVPPVTAARAGGRRRVHPAHRAALATLPVYPDQQRADEDEKAEEKGPADGGNRETGRRDQDPASSDTGSQRTRAVRASRSTPRTTSSAPVRNHQRIRLIRAGRAPLGAVRALDLPTATAVELHTTRFRRRGRSLMAASL